MSATTNLEHRKYARARREQRVAQELRAARRLGFEVSQLEGDLIVMRSRPGGHTVQHLTTLRGEAIGLSGREGVIQYLLCDVWWPDAVCPCGQLTVDWVPSEVTHGTETRREF